MTIPEKLLYTKEHEWVKKEDGQVTIGITDFAQSQLGDIIFLELPEEIPFDTIRLFVFGATCNIFVPVSACW